LLAVPVHEQLSEILSLIKDHIYEQSFNEMAMAIARAEVAGY